MYEFPGYSFSSSRIYQSDRLGIQNTRIGIHLLQIAR